MTNPIDVEMLAIRLDRHSYVRRDLVNAARLLRLFNAEHETNTPAPDDYFQNGFCETCYSSIDGGHTAHCEWNAVEAALKEQEK